MKALAMLSLAIIDWMWKSTRFMLALALALLCVVCISLELAWQIGAYL